MYKYFKKSLIRFIPSFLLYKKLFKIIQKYIPYLHKVALIILFKEMATVLYSNHHRLKFYQKNHYCMQPHRTAYVLNTEN